MLDEPGPPRRLLVGGRTVDIPEGTIERGGSLRLLWREDGEWEVQPDALAQISLAVFRERVLAGKAAVVIVWPGAMVIADIDDEGMSVEVVSE